MNKYDSLMHLFTENDTMSMEGDGPTVKVRGKSLTIGRTSELCVRWENFEEAGR